VPDPQRRRRARRGATGPDRRPSLRASRARRPPPCWQHPQGCGRLSAPVPEIWRDAHGVLGPDNPFTLASCDTLSLVYEAAGRTGEAIALYEQVLADRERVLGPDHPDTLQSRNDLASAYRAAGRTGESVDANAQPSDP
jgi:hypothetical protein